MDISASYIPMSSLLSLHKVISRVTAIAQKDHV
jgi:hypothetical protein